MHALRPDHDSSQRLSLRWDIRDPGIGEGLFYPRLHDLLRGLVHLYLWHQYEEVATINAADEIAKQVSAAERNGTAGLQSTPTRIRDLFSPETARRAEGEHRDYKSEQPTQDE